MLRSRLRCFSSSSGRAVDTLVVGGGVMGSSLALHLASLRGTGEGITVVERDPTYQTASATLSAGGIRQQFSLLENVQMSLYGVDFLRNAATRLAVDGAESVDVQFQERGYLFLASEGAGHETLLRNHATQKAAGVDWMQILTPTELAAKFPWMSTDGIAAASLGTASEGWFDPWALLRGMRRKAIALGVSYLDGTPVAATRDGARVASVDVELRDGGGVERLQPRVVANAAGAHARAVLEKLAAGGPAVAALPVAPRKRCVFVLKTPAPPCPPEPAVPLWHAPLTVDTSGVYFRPEGASSRDTFLCGVSPDAAADEDVADAGALAVGEDDHRTLFEETIWPALYSRVEAFGELKVQASWAGLYEYNTLDQNAVIGWHPELHNVVHLCGFSGHGLQQAPAAGRAVAELIEHGRYTTLDLSIFGFERVLRNEPVRETGIV